MIAARFNDKFQLKYPMYALRSILNDSTQEVLGFRPVNEIQRILSSACQIKRNDPSQLYKIVSKIG